MNRKKCYSCGYLQKSEYKIEDGMSCDSCCEPLFNEYGKYANGRAGEE